MEFNKKEYINKNYDKFLLNLKITNKELLMLLNKKVHPRISKLTAKEQKILAYFALFCHQKGPALSKKRAQSFIRNLKSQREFVKNYIKYWEYFTKVSKTKKK